MKQSMMVLCALLLLTACSEPEPGLLYTQCVFNAAETIDDGVSDVQTIATRVAAACARERLDMIKELLASSNLPSPGNDFVQAQVKDLDMPTRVVSILRSAQKQNQPKAPELAGSAPTPTDYSRCITTAAETMDDGVSDLLTMATRIDTACEREKRSAIQSTLASMNVDPNSKMGREIMQSQLQDRNLAGNIVAATRAIRAVNQP